MRFKKYIGCGALLLSCGCGSDDSDPSAKDSLIGKWAADIPGSPSCFFGASFNTNDVYETDIVCPLADGAYGVEAEVGTYVVDGDVLNVVPTHASCRQPDRTHNVESLSFSVSDTTLRVVRSTGAIVFRKLTSDPNELGSSDAVLRFGCANADGFVRAEIAPL